MSINKVELLLNEIQRKIRYSDSVNFKLIQKELAEIAENNNELTLAWKLLGFISNINGDFKTSSFALNRAILLDPNDSETYNNLASTYFSLKRYEKAKKFYLNSINLNKKNPEIWKNLGLVQIELNQLEESKLSFEKAIRINGNYFEAYYNLGLVMLLIFDFKKAINYFEIANNINPKHAKASLNLGIAYKKIGLIEKAIECYSKAIKINNKFSEAYFNRGVLFHDLKNYDLALKDYTKTLLINKNYIKAYINIGAIKKEEKRISESIENYNKALEVEPVSTSAKWNLSLVLLLSENFEKGLELYESRWEMKEFEPQKINSIMPRWDGTLSIKGKKVLVHAEQGLGDSIQFCRYLEEVEALGAEVIFKVQKPLIALFKNLAGVKHLLALGDTNPTHDLHVPLLSLPGIFNTEVISIRRCDNYLTAEPQRIARWKGALREDSYKIGINWQGSHGTQIDIGRSFNVSLFEQISQIPNVQLISLQKGYGSEQLQDLPSGMKVLELGDDVDADGAFLDTAAVMENLDLVISSDTAVVHLAGALGVKTWVALKFVPDWRWMLDRADSPWYPSLTLYRQEVACEWGPVFKKMHTDLTGLLKSKPLIST
jgi:tetratricopeptide (TPR) repeat protein